MVLITQSDEQTLKPGSPIPDFSLPGTDGSVYSLHSFRESKALVLCFTCNHCPYARAYDQRIEELLLALGPKGMALAAINCNDARHYPDDSFEAMKARALPYPYLRDETQAVAKAYGAVCTPHFFVANAERTLVYEGRLDDNWKNPQAVRSADLQNTVEAVLADRPVPQAATNPMGCSIKWL